MPTMLKAADRKALLALIESAEEHFNSLPSPDDLRAEGVNDAREKVDEKSEKWLENEDNQNKVDGLEQIESEIESYEAAYEDMNHALGTLKELLA